MIIIFKMVHPLGKKYNGVNPVFLKTASDLCLKKVVIKMRVPRVHKAKIGGGILYYGCPFLSFAHQNLTGSAAATAFLAPI